MFDFSIPNLFKSVEKMEIKGEMTQDDIRRLIDCRNECRQRISYGWTFLLGCIGVAVILFSVGYLFR